MEQRDERGVLEELVLDSMGSLGICLDQLQLGIWQQLLVQLVQHGYIGPIVELVGSSEQLVDDPNGYMLELVDSSGWLVDPNDCKLEHVLGHGGQHYHRLGIQGTLIKKLFY